MIEVIKNEGNTIHYTCSCGAIGKCMIKPLSESAAIIVDINCPMCDAVERVTLLQYTTEEEKEAILNDFENTDFSWSIILSNESVGGSRW